MKKTKAKRQFRLRGLAYDPVKGKAHLEVCLPGTQGEGRRRRTVKVPDYEAAVEARRKFREEVGLRGGKTAVWTVASYIAEHQKALTSRVAKSTARNLAYRYDVLTRFLGPVRLDRVNSAVVRDFVAAADESGLGTPTINGLLATLRRVLRDAVERQELAAYPIRERLPMRRMEPLRQELSDEERLALLAAFDNEPGFRRLIAEQRVAKIEEGSTPKAFAVPEGDEAGVFFSFFRATRPIYVIALETGLARQDLLSLTWEEASRDPIRKHRGKTNVESVIPKSKACKAALEELRSRPVVHAERVCIGPEGRPMCIDSLNRYFRVAKKLAGLKRRIRFHDLRHTFGCRLVSAGVPLTMVAKAMGHSSIKQTEQYARPSEESMKAVSAALDRETKPHELTHELPPLRNRRERT